MQKLKDKIMQKLKDKISKAVQKNFGGGGGEQLDPPSTDKGRVK